MSSIVIVGAGWAGLNCAYELCKQGHEVTILEAAPQSGGRARSIKFQNYILDNGQHLAIGAYHTLRQTLRELNIDEASVFKILPLNLSYQNSPQLNLKLSNFLPSPFNLLFGILTAKNWPLLEKYYTLKFCRKLYNTKFKLEKDCSVFELLLNYNQSEFIIQHFWEPLALAIMTTDIKIASAQVFLNVLKQSFMHSSTDSNWYIPSTDLTQLLPMHMEKYLLANGAKIFHHQMVKKIAVQPDSTLSAITDKQIWQAKHIVIATAPWQATKLLHDHPELLNLQQKLQSFIFQPITTIYLIFAQPVLLPYPIHGLTKSKCHWILDRGVAGQPNIISAVISGNAAINYCSQEEFVQQIYQEISSHFLNLPKLLDYKFICEKRAAFSCDVATQELRPSPVTVIKNLWLTGDYLQTGFPSTLEGALLSGKQTAENIQTSINNV